jgi:Ca-activated chloride channel family protein
MRYDIMKQIILITDGCSNEGISPVTAAANASSEGIVVNVIGVISQGELDQRGRDEIQQIAEAGGGMSRVISSKQLAQTVQMMTRKTIAHTIHQVVNKELKHILGDGRVEDLPPAQRSKVVQVMEDLGETSDLKVALLIDASASMKPKLHAVEDAIYDLMLSLQARQGKSYISVFHYPGGTGQDSVMDLDWTSQLAKMTNLFYKIRMSGTTPTGPALLDLAQWINGGGLERNMELKQWGQSAKAYNHPKDGMLGDYVV